MNVSDVFKVVWCQPFCFKFYLKQTKRKKEKKKKTKEKVYVFSYQNMLKHSSWCLRMVCSMSTMKGVSGRAAHSHTTSTSYGFEKLLLTAVVRRRKPLCVVHTSMNVLNNTEHINLNMYSWSISIHYLVYVRFVCACVTPIIIHDNMLS